jgi:hypothetical protein
MIHDNYIDFVAKGFFTFFHSFLLDPKADLSAMARTQLGADSKYFAAGSRFQGQIFRLPWHNV